MAPRGQSFIVYLPFLPKQSDSPNSPLKPSAKSSIFNLLSLYEQRKEMHIVYSESDGET